MAYLEFKELTIELYSGQNVETSPKKNTEIMNMYYVNKVKTIQQNLPPPSMIDLSAAFDVVDGNLLVAKLEFYGFSSQTKYWVKSYMSGRFSGAT